jgi:hypothetical protein
MRVLVRESRMMPHHARTRQLIATPRSFGLRLLVILSAAKDLAVLLALAWRWRGAWTIALARGRASLPCSVRLPPTLVILSAAKDLALTLVRARWFLRVASQACPVPCGCRRLLSS